MSRRKSKNKSKTDPATKNAVENKETSPPEAEMKDRNPQVESTPKVQTTQVEKAEGRDEPTPKASVASPPRFKEEKPVYKAGDKKVQQLALIATWLTDEVMGYDADPLEMEHYAFKFLEKGLHSPTMISQLCTPADITRFTWMRDFHKRRFLSVMEKAALDKTHWYKPVAEISDWLETEAIGFDPDKMEMGLYAQKFVDLGYHSVKMIQELLTPDEVASFVWMKPIHKKLFLMKAKLHRIHSIHKG